VSTHRGSDVLQQSGEYYGSVPEHAFASIERTLEGYLIAFADYEVTDFHDHTTVYRRGKQQVPLTPETLETLEALYDDRRTEHYYGTTVTTKRQAETMLKVAVALHDHIVRFDPKLTGYCNCGK
jgi:DNA replicative helicase MCM subunit Mcm2 (Cdc46/Mcm family)